MSFEDQVRFKHAVEDSLLELIRFGSLLTARELELTIAKLGDSTQEKEESFVQQQALKAQILDYLRTTRSEAPSLGEKAKRLWFTRKGAQIRNEVAEHRYGLRAIEYENECASLEEENKKADRRYEQAYTDWLVEKRSVPLFKRLFGRTPQKPLMPAIQRPHIDRPRLIDFISQAKKLGPGELLIERILIHEFPDVEIAREYATEEGVRSFEQKLLEHSE